MWWPLFLGASLHIEHYYAQWYEVYKVDVENSQVSDKLIQSHL